jgi:hypothetical protein
MLMGFGWVSYSYTAVQKLGKFSAEIFFTNNLVIQDPRFDFVKVFYLA